MEHEKKDAFLQAEEQANALLHELHALKDEAVSYKNAQGALDQAAAGVSDLAIRIGEVAENMVEVASVMRAIGTPKLMAGQREIIDLINQSLDANKEQRREIGEENLALHKEIGMLKEKSETQNKKVRNLLIANLSIGLVISSLLIVFIMRL